MSAVVLALLLAGGADPVREAERLAAEATTLAKEQPQQAETTARRALAMTEEFEPTIFVKAGRKGEVVEDAFQAARDSYRRHRAGLYQAMGAALLGAGRPEAAVRYLRRAVVLDPSPERVIALARAWLVRGEGRVALEVLHAHAGQAGLTGEARALVEEATDAAGAPSAQAEIDRSRLRALGLGEVEYRDGPFKPPPGARLSTGAAFRLDVAGVTVLYVAERSCKSCSEDLIALERAVRPDTAVVLVPEVADEDYALRQVLRLYRHQWPVLQGRGAAAALGLEPRGLLAVARMGWAGALIRPKASFGEALRSVVSVFARTDVQEAVPRPGWNGRPVSRPALAGQPALLPEGLAPGEDEPYPEEFTRAVAAFRAKRYAEAMRLFEALQARGDGWLLAAEARLDRALCLAGLGQRETARRLLLRTGDGRFQEAVDRALEDAGASSQRPQRRP